MNALIYAVISAMYITVASPARHRLESFGGPYGGHIEYNDFVPGQTVPGPHIVGPRGSASQLVSPHIGLTYVLGPEFGPPRIVTPIIVPGHIVDPEGTHEPIVGPTVGVFSIVGPPNPWAKFAEAGYQWKNGWMDW
ncbi:hypothetical protein NQ315_007540 [Exocentrus adspersus]|uniref:Uncharacterized protein n=1 Tax=Exocentrus adspersus TaxID=1586481 RepID=A0AAV8W780_9CUCU|nr:hypothetical protein NQ315_007540 [Exocentrus adspersus]